MALAAQQDTATTHDGGTSVPSHIAIIMDGNARWAKKHGVSLQEGHHQGAEALRRTLKHCRNLPFIKHVTVYAFSSENWKRPKSEISHLMNLLRLFFRNELKTLLKENIRIRFIGDHGTLDPDIQKILRDVETKSADNTALTLSIAISYGGRQEITDAVQTIAQQVSEGALHPTDITADLISDTLQSAYLPEPDLLIRTGGERRLSNFLVWQSAYTELYFSDALWPDFNGDMLEEAVSYYANRERRFGGRNTA